MPKRELGMMVTLALLAGILAVFVPTKFLNDVNLYNLGERVSLLSIFAIGQAIVIIAGGIDLSVGSVIALSGVLAAYLTKQHHWSFPAAAAVSLAAAAVAGAVQGGLVTGLNLQPFIVTLGGMMLFRGIADTISESQDISYPKELEHVTAWGKRSVFGLPNQLWILLGVAGAAFFIMRWTLFGRYAYAVGSNNEAARLSGLPVRRIRFATYVISATLAGVAGLLYSLYLQSASPSMGEMQELYAIAAAVLGGCSLRGGQGSVLGVLIGAGIMHTIYNGINLLEISTHWVRTIVGAIILIAAIVDEWLARRRRAR